MDTVATMQTNTYYTALKCLRCGYEWHPRRPIKPNRCANIYCRSPYWQTQRKTPAPVRRKA